MHKPIGILAIDIETNGPSMLKHEIISIGYCFGMPDGEIILSNRINFKITTDFEPNCLKFWNTIPEVLQSLQENALEPDRAIKMFIDLVDDFDKNFDLRILSDLVVFDISFINYYIAKYIDRLPLTYIFGDGSKFRTIIDTDSYQRGILKQNFFPMFTSDKDVVDKYQLILSKKHSHYPDEDAMYIFNLATEFVKSSCH